MVEREVYGAQRLREKCMGRKMKHRLREKFTGRKDWERSLRGAKWSTGWERSLRGAPRRTQAQWSTTELPGANFFPLMYGVPDANAAPWHRGWQRSYSCVMLGSFCPMCLSRLTPGMPWVVRVCEPGSLLSSALCSQQAHCCDSWTSPVCPRTLWVLRGWSAPCSRCWSWSCACLSSSLF